jgi:predicted transglutaminase-like cysteine proteinase
MRNRTARIVVLGIVMLGLAAALTAPLAEAEAKPHTHRPDAGQHVDSIEAMLAPSGLSHTAPVGDVTRVPYGWADFCGRRPEECRVDVLEPVDVKMTARVMRTLETLNEKVNEEIEPVSNLDHWGTILDHWDYPVDGKGDCKIYALWKRKRLLDLGFPRQALLMTIVRDLEGNGHTVLTVKTDRGDFVLDNMVGEIRLWDETGYQFVKRQSQSDPNVWVSIGPATMPVTTAVVH